MKSIKILITVLGLFICTGMAGQVQAPYGKDNVSVQLSIAGMACQEGCADTIAKNLKALKGVLEVAVSYERGLAIVHFDPDDTDLETIENTITETKVKDYEYTIQEVTKIGPKHQRP